MEKVAKFEKVSFEQFLKDYIDTFGDTPKEKVKELYDSIKLPKRGTKFSAGYDFFAYQPITLKPGEGIKYPSGIRCKIREDYVLLIMPRSSLGFKYRLQLDNTIGVIDADYYNAKNEGHMFIKMTNDSRANKEMVVLPNEGYAQGIFMSYGITEDDEVSATRTGGFGSTTK
jgi:dUTP pyrophosphatase